LREKFKTPILLLFFNRRKQLNRLLQIVKSVNPVTVYLASDGPRSNVPNEDTVITEIRVMAVNALRGTCEIKTLFRQENLGCKYAVHSALQWFFKNEDSGIVLEDDIEPSMHFFFFCQELLEKYKEDKSIGSISGRNELGEYGENDCFTANRFSCWGWASWSDRIMGMDIEYGYKMSPDYSELYKGASWKEFCYVKSVLGLLQTKQVNSWAYAYDLNFRRKGQLQIYPKYNMCRNAGFGNEGTHSKSRATDGVHVYRNFIPDCKSISIETDAEYINQKLDGEYGGKVMLILMVFSRWLRYPKKLYRSLRCLF
jgi:hypothetical protein